ncbi:DNRLRE domain-containing protein [Paenibacillus sp. HWE-109]|uniref:CBM96 family carbohydrate-binding protein n=1 Tax=Paenibacillus sp. HWE-109 TaxID=1306526 RepID=UPI001EE0C761|nr:DNRLRE domain-containing protein [Paenibacillus sp. HWE-109]UKS30495.1 DNRLRE domain-containing protein [Paenibacillus sp. HWE-109]
MFKPLKRLSSKVWTIGLISTLMVTTLPVLAGAAATSMLSPSDDTYVYQSNPSTNFGTATSLFVKNDASASRYAFLKFDLAGISGVTSAKLRVYGSASSTTVLSAYQTTDSWTQSGLIWTNKPAVGSSAGSVSINTTNTYNEIDVTSYVAAEAGSDHTVSFALQESVGKYTTLNSKENAVNKPQLVVVSGGGSPGDTQSPTAPTGVTGTAASSSQININWNASTDNVAVTGYEVYRNGTLITSVAGISAMDTGLSSSTTYSYYIKAKDAAGNASAQSSTITATTLAGSTPNGCTNALNSTTAIQNAMKNASAGTVISIAPGTYYGDRATSGDPGGQGLFFSDKNGTAASPIILKSCDAANPAVLKGAGVNDGSYGIHLTGDYWQLRDMDVNTAQKGIIIDNGNRNLLNNVKVHNVGDEGVHFRDGSSYNTLEYSLIYDTGKYQAGYGEGAYVGSDSSSNYEHVVTGNVISHTNFNGGITAEHIDVKEGASGTIIEYCTFNGTGISGANSADSFIDVKGVNTIVRYNQGYRNGNTNVVDAFQVRTHGTDYVTGTNNSFDHNTVNLDNSAGYVVYATSAATGTTAQNDTRTGGGNLYNSNVNK